MVRGQQEGLSLCVPACRAVCHAMPCCAVRHVGSARCCAVLLMIALSTQTPAVAVGVLLASQLCKATPPGIFRRLVVGGPAVVAGYGGCVCLQPAAQQACVPGVLFVHC